MERDGVVRRFVHHQVPPKVEYSLTDWGQALCPALNALLIWVDVRPSTEAVPSELNPSTNLSAATSGSASR
jgi:DNA-binding HxlR family transcriptional regulator